MIYIYEMQAQPADVFCDIVGEYEDDTPMRDIVKSTRKVAMEAVKMYKDGCLVEFTESEGMPVFDLYNLNKECIHRVYAEKMTTFA